jgi:hypothetical protein
MIELRDVVSGLALCVSLASFYVSWRTAQKSNVNAWIELAALEDREWHLATLTVKNPSHLDIAVKKVDISLPDFRLGDLNEALVTSPSGERSLPKTIGITPQSLVLSFNDFTVAADAKTVKQFLVYQPSHNRKKTAVVRVMYATREPKPKWVILPVKIRTRSDI